MCCRIQDILGNTSYLYRGLNRHVNMQTDMQTRKQTCRHANRHVIMQTDMQTCRQQNANGQTCKQNASRHADGLQRGRSEDRHLKSGDSHTENSVRGCKVGILVVKTCLWLVGNGGMGTIISTITTILPFPTNQR